MDHRRTEFAYRWDWYTLRQHWYREPLYNSKGEYTREYSRRLEFEFMEMLKAYEVQTY
jgi:hypothetical protein